MTPPAGLRRLLTAAELCLDRERAALQRIDDAAAALRSEADALRRARVSGEDLLALRGEIAGLMPAWETRRDLRVAKIERTLAELAADREEARGLVARACGRALAIRRLAGR